MARRSSMLASDADRESVTERLKQAAMEGRILAHELEERLARALRARTYGELDQVVADLPRASSPTRRRSRTSSLARSHPVAAVAILVAVTLVLFVTAAVVAFTGIWVLFLVVLLAGRGPWSRGRGPYRRPGPYQGYGRRGRSAYWVR